MKHLNRKKKNAIRKPIKWPDSKKPTLLVIEVNGKRNGCYSIHRETYVRNPETCECLRMEEWHNVSLWPIFSALAEDENQEYVLLFPPLPSHWQTFDVWEMKGTRPLYRGGIKRNKDGVYIIR